MTRYRAYLSLGVGVLAALIYGGVSHLLFAPNTQSVGTLSVSFVLLVPPVLGFLTVIFATEQQQKSWRFFLFMPWLSCLLCMALAAVFLLEAWFCILLAAPLWLALASAGGAAAALVARYARERGSNQIVGGAILVFTLAPFVFVPLERLLPLQPETRTVHSQIEIGAPAAIIWQNITDLRPIGPSEQRESLFHLAGLPRPLEARMACLQVGCIRRGMWESGLAFAGTITRIAPGQAYWLDLRADTQNVLPSGAPLSQIGGAAFAMVDDGYEIVAGDGGRSVLHLYSTYRLTTRINAYGAFWIDWMLHDMQAYILAVEKARSESAGN